MAAPVLQFKRGNLASLPGLQAGEPGFTVDKNDLYVGIDSTTGNNQFIGSGRFWEKGDATNASGVKLVEAQNNGASAITIKAPASLGDNQVYTMPAAAVANGFLKSNASGELSFDTTPQNAGAVTEITVADESSDTTCFPLFSVSATGDIEPKTGSNLTFNSSSGALTATSFVGNLTGNVTGNTSGSSGSCTGNSATATALANARTIGGVSFDGTANINLPGVNEAGTQNTTGTSGGLTGTPNITVGTIEGTSLTLSGNLTVNGTTSSLNTVNTTIEDVLLELQVVDGGALSSDTNKDVGVVFNYYSGSAKKAAVYWDDSAGRIVVGSEVSESSGVLTASAFSGLEIGSLFVNDCAGQTQVISCSGTTRSLENITIDGGSF